VEIVDINSLATAPPGVWTFYLRHYYQLTFGLMVSRKKFELRKKHFDVL